MHKKQKLSYHQVFTNSSDDIWLKKYKIRCLMFYTGFLVFCTVIPINIQNSKKLEQFSFYN